MGIAIFFMILSIIVIIVTVIYVRKNNRFYKFQAKGKEGIKKQKKNIKNIWGIEEIVDGIITNSQGQQSMIMELGSIEYRLLNETEQASIDAALTRISRTLSYNMQFFSTIVKVDTNEKIDEIKENMKKQRNPKMTEYGEAVIEYLEDIMQEDDLYVRKNYIIISSCEPLDEARKNLTIFCNTLKGNLNNIKIGAKILNDVGIIELIHRELNKDSTENIEKIIKEGGLDIYVQSQEDEKKERKENIFEEKQKKYKKAE